MKYLITITLLLIAFVTSASERFVYENRPLKLALAPNSETLVIFKDRQVSVELPTEISNKVIVDNAGGVLYFRARGAFNPERITIQDLNTQEVFFIDLSAASDAVHRDTIMVYTRDQITKIAEEEAKSSLSKSAAIIKLLREASQELYAPEEWREKQQGVRPVLIQKQKVGLIKDRLVDAYTLKSWSIGGLYITAVEIVNKEPKRINVHELNYRGTWLYRSSQHTFIEASNVKGKNLTTVYMFSSSPFLEALI